MKKLTSWVNFFRPAPLKRKAQKIYTKLTKTVDKSPLTSFFVVLALVFAAIAIGHFIRKPDEDTASREKAPVTVETYKIGEAPRIRVNAQIEKTGIVDITAQTPAIVDSINTIEGQTVLRGTNIVSLSSNYVGGNPATAQRQLAQTQLANVQETYNLQKDLIVKQRDIANKQAQNSQELKDITSKSLDETRSLISLNESIQTTVNDNLKTLESTNINGTNDELILSTKLQQSQIQATLNQLRSGTRSAEQQTDTNKAPNQLIDIQKDIALKQLAIQEKGLELARKTASLQVKLAQINESLFFPSSPFEGKVEKINIEVGQSVTPGTVLATIVSENTAATAVAFVPAKIAKNFSTYEESYLIIDSQKIAAPIVHVSQEAVNGQLYSITFAIDSTVRTNLTDKSIVEVDIPVGVEKAQTTAPYIPIDSIHQTQDKAYVFTIKEGTAEAKEVILGLVQGKFVEITSGISNSDEVITTRNVVAGDKVQTN